MGTPDHKNTQDSVGFFAKVINRIKNTLHEATQKVNAEERNNFDDWEDDFASSNISSTDNKKQPRIRSGLNLKQHDNNSEYEDEITSKKRKNPFNVKTIIILIFIFIIIGCILLLFFKSSNNGRNSNIDDVKRSRTLRPGEKKLDRPIWGQPSEEQKSRAQGELGKIHFDFSPLQMPEIEKAPLLPQKVKPKTNRERNEFEDIWNNTSNNNTNQIEQETSLETILPPWRRFAADYQPTNGMPIFSVVLKYSPDLLSVDDLPDGNGYTVVIPGFMNYSEPLVKQLRDKNYEILFYLPMGNNIGEYSIKPINKNSAFDAIRDAVAFHTSQVGGNGFVGFMNYTKQNDPIRESLTEMNFLMSLLAKTGYLYLDSKYPNEKSLAFAAAEGQKVPALRTDIQIENVRLEFPQFIKHVQLDQMGIAVIEATPENIVALKQYEPALKNERVMRVPLSAILKHQMINE